MKITAKEFKDSPKKSITLIGMSGAGKTHISSQLANWGWSNYSCDYEIGANSLKEALVGDKKFTVNDISALSNYLGKLGNPDKGGFPLDKFKERQKVYYDAEVMALKAMGEFAKSAKTSFIHDSTGSLCEIEDKNLIQEIGEQTLFVYLKTGEKEDKEVLKRASENPKPLFFPPAFLDDNVHEFLDEFNIAAIDEITPDDFARWVFPKLFEARKPKYQNLADLYGVTIPSSEFKDLKSSDEFNKIIENHL